VTANRDIKEWKSDVRKFSEVLYRTLESVKSLYGDSPVVPAEPEIRQAFIHSLVDIGRYCADNHIFVKTPDAVKLMAFSIPHLLTIRNYALRIDMYTHACLRMIHGIKNNHPVPDYKDFVHTSNVAIHLCLRYPSNHLILYGYLKGYQEALEKNFF
jgi:hypothetical protein